MSVGRLVGWLAGRLVGFDSNTPRSRRILGSPPPQLSSLGLVNVLSSSGVKADHGRPRGNYWKSLGTLLLLPKLLHKLNVRPSGRPSHRWGKKN